MRIAIINYPKALQSAVFGLGEMFSVANRLCKEHQLPQQFDIDIIPSNQLELPLWNDHRYTAVLLPPSLDNSYYFDPTESLTQWLINKHLEGSILCSVCAGLFILASTELLSSREVTTHWELADAFNRRYPHVNLNVDRILVNDNDIVTAGGVMSWVDLGLELVAQFTKPTIMRQLGKILVVDTGKQQQKYYQLFLPKFDHGDKEILSVQRKLETDYKQAIKISELAEFCYLTERTFSRRFVKATGLKPNNYLQKLRIQKACGLLENTQLPFETIAYEVGYEDPGACRKIFNRIMGLTPGEFRKRFADSSS